MYDGECTKVKRCGGKNGCGRWKLLGEFNKKQAKCRDCQKIYDKKYHKEHSEERKQYLNNNKDKKKKWDKKYRETHKESLRQYFRDYYARNSEHLKLYAKEHSKSTIDLRRLYRREYDKKRMQTDINYKIAHYLRARLRKAIKNNSKVGSAVSDLGCTISELKSMLEQDFYLHPITGKQMTWENYGKEWHIDHVIPLCSFDLTDRNQLLEAVHYGNLRPLWIEDNLKKISEDRKKSIKNILETK